MFKGKKKKKAQPTPGSKYTGNVSCTRVKANQDCVELCGGGQPSLKVGGADLSCLRKMTDLHFKNVLVYLVYVKF